MEKDSRRWMVAAGLVGATVAVLFLRRPDQFLSPYIWVEDGTIVLPAFAARGWWSILEPVNGYLIMASKLITLSAFQISFGLAAHIALWLTVAFTTLVVLAVAFSPTHLRYKPLCALAVLLVPTDAEVFAVSEYAFWWAGILLILAVLWDGGRPWLRAGYVLLGGLSSPLIGPVAILLAIRAAWERCSTGMALAAMAVSLAALQAGVAYVTIHNSGAATLGLLAAHTAVDKLVGFFLFGSYTVQVGRFANLGFVILGAIAALVWYRREMLGRPFALLAALWAVACVLAVVRVPASDLHPFLAGPRYFFYPYVLMTWACLWLASLSDWRVKVAMTGAYMFALMSAVTFNPTNGFAGWSRRQATLDWRAHVQQCAMAAEYKLPIHTTGAPNALWYVPLSGAQCRNLIDRSLTRSLRGPRKLLSPRVA